MKQPARLLLRFSGLVAVALLLASVVSEISRSRRMALAREAPPIPLDNQVPSPHFEQRAASVGTPEAAPQQIPLPTATRTPTPINIGNSVWDDLDKDGRQDAGEPGLSGVTMQLWNSSKTQLLDATTTSSSGSYTLVAPVPGQYRVRALLPNPDIDQFSPKDSATAGDLLDSDINPSGTNFGFTDIFNLASNVISITTIDIGIIKYRPPTATRTPTPINIGNFIWYDINANGFQDIGEPGLSSITVQLWNSTKTQLIAQAVTTNGAYSLIAPLPGDYRMRVIPPSGASIAPKDQGADDLDDSDVNPSGVNAGFTDVFNLASNVISITSIDAGLINVPATPTPSVTPTPTTTPTSTVTPTVTDTPTATVESTSEALFVQYMYLPAVRN